jgi:p-cumate 2,3-dioxygenase subunit beta
MQVPQATIMSESAGDGVRVAITDPDVLCAVEQFLYLEAALLDDWQLDEWLALMHPEVHYRVPAPGSELSDSDLTLQIIHDDYKLLQGRVTRLKSKHAHAESPKSRTRRTVSNIRAERDRSGEIIVFSNFSVLRNRLGKLDHFIGSYRHLLVPLPQPNADLSIAGRYRIHDRLAVLDHDLIESGGTVSIVL